MIAPKCTATSYQGSITKANLRFSQWFQTVINYFDCLTLSWRHIWPSEMLRTTYPIAQHIPKDLYLQDKHTICLLISYHQLDFGERLTHFLLFPIFPSLCGRDIIPCSYASFLYHQSIFAQDALNSKIDIFVNCNWVNTRWQCYSTHNQYIEQHHNNRTTQITAQHNDNYEGRTESHEQLFFASELGTADEGEYGGRWNQLLCYP